MKRLIASVTTTAAALLIIGTAPASAATLDAAADTFVYNANPTNNYGSNTTFDVANDGGSAIPKGKDRLGVVRFDLSSVGGTITGATLQLTATVNPDFVFTIYGIDDGGAEENFDEATLTFNSFPYSSATGADGSIVTTGLTELVTGVTDDTSIADDNLLEASSTALLDFINADTNNIVTFVIFHTSPQNGNYARFYSSESTSGAGPKLVLNVVPEPTSLAAILGIGAMMLVRRRDRRA